MFAMTLPALVILLFVLGIADMIASRARRRRGGDAMRGGFTGFGLDVLEAALYPEKRHQIEEDESRRMRRDDEDDGAPPLSTVDLASGVARIRVTSTLPEHGDDTLGDREAR